MKLSTQFSVYVTKLARKWFPVLFIAISANTTLIKVNWILVFQSFSRLTWFRFDGLDLGDG